MTAPAQGSRVGRPGSAIVFDLFGTLVPQFPRQAHDQVLEECSAIVGIDADLCRSAWRRLYDDRVTGRVRGIEGHLSAVAHESCVELNPDRVGGAIAHYREFARQLVVPSHGTLRSLDALKARGAVLGLLSNAHDDVAATFADSELAGYFAAVTFSCAVGYRKPHPGAFAAILGALGAPAHVTFVGDGSDDELDGASRAGFYPVLLRGDLANAYDPDRSEVAEWTGTVVDKLDDLIPLLASGPF